MDNTYKKVSEFCKEVKKLAKNFQNFSDFEIVAKELGRTQKVLKPVDFIRLVQVASVEANLQ